MSNDKGAFFKELPSLEFGQRFRIWPEGSGNHIDMNLLGLKSEGRDSFELSMTIRGQANSSRGARGEKNAHLSFEVAHTLLSGVVEHMQALGYHVGYTGVHVDYTGSSTLKSFKSPVLQMSEYDSYGQATPDCAMRAEFRFCDNDKIPASGDEFLSALKEAFAVTVAKHPGLLQYLFSSEPKPAPIAGYISRHARMEDTPIDAAYSGVNGYGDFSLSVHDVSLPAGEKWEPVVSHPRGGAKSWIFAEKLADTVQLKLKNQNIGVGERSIGPDGASIRFSLHSENTKSEALFASVQTAYEDALREMSSQLAQVRTEYKKAQQAAAGLGHS